MATSECSAEVVEKVTSFFKHLGVGGKVPEDYETKDFYSELVAGVLKVDEIQRGKINCSLTVKPVITNFYGGLHGGAVATVSEKLSYACVRTVVAADKDIFLGELGISYLSAAPMNAELLVQANLVRSGRNLTVVAIEFRFKNTGKLVYTARSTFYHMHPSKL